METFYSFCSNTSLNGWGHIPGSSSKEKLFWFLTIIGSFGAASYFTSSAISEFLAATVITKLDSSTVAVMETNFPKITLQNSYRLRKSFVDSIVKPNFEDAEIIESFLYKYYITGQEPDQLEEETAEKYDITDSFFLKQLPIYMSKDDVGSVVSQNFEDFFISIKDGGNTSIFPLIERETQWNYKLDVYYLPCLDVYHSSEITRSGQSNGLELMIDLETFDNADAGVDYDALQVIIQNKDNFPIFDLHGLSIKPGEMARIRISPKLYRISDSAVSRFDYLKRKCIADSDNITLNVSDFSITHYTYTNCFIAAAVEEMNSNCLKKNGTVKPGTVDKNLACKHQYLSQVGRWKLDKKSNKYCFPSCLRSSIYNTGLLDAIYRYVLYFNSSSVSF